MMKAESAFRNIVQNIADNESIEAEMLDDLRSIASALGATNAEIDAPAPEGLDLAYPEDEEDDDDDESEDA